MKYLTRKPAFKIQAFVLFLFVAFCYSVVSAQSSPRWVQKGVNSIMNNRSNETYTFEIFNTHNYQLQPLLDTKTDVLKDYVKQNFPDADDESIIVQQRLAGDMPEYIVAFTDKDGQQHDIVAKLVDEYSELDDYDNENFEFEYYQLYAISKADEQPVFDNFELTRHYNQKATALSIVPGLGQIYKGQPTKAYVIIGAEVFFVGAAAIFEYNRHMNKKDMLKDDLSVWPSWRSKMTGWRNFRNIAIGGAIGTYIYNLLDAALANGSRNVIVSPAGKTSLAISPYASFDDAGIAVRITF